MTDKQLLRLTKAELVERLTTLQRTEEEVRTKFLLVAVAATLLGLAL